MGQITFCGSFQIVRDRGPDYWMLLFHTCYLLIVREDKLPLPICSRKHYIPGCRQFTIGDMIKLINILIQAAVQPLDMVENSIGTLRTHFGWFLHIR